MDDFTRSLLPTSPVENDMTDYAPPLVCLILTIIAAAELIGGCILAVVISQSTPALRWYAAAGVAMSVITAATTYALAQFCDLAGRTEFHARKLHTIETHLARIVRG